MRHMCTRDIFIYSYIVIIVPTTYLLLVCTHTNVALRRIIPYHTIAIFELCRVVLLSLSFVLACRFANNTTQPSTAYYMTTWLHDYKPLQAVAYYICHTTFCRWIPYLYIVWLLTYYLLTTYSNRNAQMTVLHRFTLFLCVLGHYRYGECPYFPPDQVAQPFQIIFYIFPVCV